MVTGLHKKAVQLIGKWKWYRYDGPLKMKEKHIERGNIESIERNFNIQTEKSENKKYSYIIYSYLSWDYAYTVFSLYVCLAS